MSSCHWQSVLYVIGIIAALLGFIVTIKVEYSNLRKGANFYQKGSFNTKKGIFSLNVSGGIALIIVGIVCFVVAKTYFPECNSGVLNNKNISNPDSTLKTKSTLEGWLIDDAGQNISGARVSVLGTLKETLSGPDGHFFLNLDDDSKSVQISVTANGFKKDSPLWINTNSVAQIILHK